MRWSPVQLVHIASVDLPLSRGGVGIAQELALDAGKLLLQILDTRLSQHEVSHGWCRGRAANRNSASPACSLRSTSALLEVDALLGEIEHLRADLIIRLASVLKLVFAVSSVAWAWSKRELERHRVDFEQLVVGLDVLAFLDEDLFDLAERCPA